MRSCPGYCKQRCDEHWGTRVSFSSGFLGVYTQQWDCWVIMRERSEFDHWAGKIPWRRKWLPTPIFLPGESHGQRILTGSIHGVMRVGHELVTKSSPAPLCSNVHPTIIDSYYSIKIVFFLKVKRKFQTCLFLRER